MATKKNLNKAEKEKVLPFYNLNLEKQISVVKAYAAFYDKNQKGAHYKNIASIAGIHRTQVSGCRKFWRSLGFLEERNGTDTPTEIAMEFVRKLEWGNEADAWTLFRNHIMDKWFVNQVMISMRLQKKMSEDELINSIGSVASTHRKGPHVIESLRILLDLLMQSKILIKDEENKKFILNTELMKNSKVLELPEKEENLILVVLGNQRYVISHEKLKGFIEKYGKKVTSKEYLVKS